MDLNKVQLIGNITKDIELKQTQSWKSVIAFNLATNRDYTDKNTWEIVKQTEFHNIVLWGKLAEIANDYCKKWNKIYLEWRLQTRKWETQNWETRYTTEIMWENLIMLWWKKDNQNTQAVEVIESKPKTNYNQKEINVEDIPF